jgi:hypothetical protein
MRRVAIVLGVMLSSQSCSSMATRATSEVLAAPTTVTIDGQSVVLQTSMWRDFMPVSPPDGKPLVAIFRPVRSDNSTPPGVRIEEAWVVFGEETWNPKITEERFASPPAQTHYEAVAREGPKWGPNVTVSVVVSIRDASGNTQLLRASNQTIGRTD